MARRIIRQAHEDTLYRYLPSAPLFPIHRDAFEAEEKNALGDPTEFALEQFRHMLNLTGCDYQLLLINFLGTLDGTSREYGVHEGEDEQTNLILQDIFLTHPLTVLQGLAHGGGGEKMSVFTLIDCEFSGFEDFRKNNVTLLSLMTLSEFLALSIAGGFITRRQFTEIRQQLLDLDNYLAEFGLPAAA